jgi:release factor glutamine methyltransferase
MITVREAFMRASSFLKERGVDEANASAELLLQHVLGVTRTKLLMMWSEPAVDRDTFDKLFELVQRRAAGEPVQYIMGETYFYGRRFQVTRSVLIPRPETELLVERILIAGRDLWGEEGRPLAVDIGTGSGAIAVSLAAEQPLWRMAASDLDPEALKVARSNAADHGVEERITFLEGDLLEPVLREFGNRIDVLVSNPPYIRTEDLHGLQREVRDYEPHLALDGGEDGLVPYRRMLEQLRKSGSAPRVIGFECGMGQAGDVAGMLREAALWEDIFIVEDYAGIERHVIGIQRK